MSDTIYCYPDSNTLINKLNITNAETLQHAEIEHTSNRLFELQNNSMKGNFDFKHLCKIHHHIFQDLYEWAGKPRTVNIGKGNLFCLVQNIDYYANSIFERYYKDCMAAGNDKDRFIQVFADHYADLNALHPFREGNGRSQREFARQLCLKCGYVFDLTKTKHEVMLSASILSFDKGDNSGLENIFKNTVIPINDYVDLQNRLNLHS